MELKKEKELPEACKICLRFNPEIQHYKPGYDQVEKPIVEDMIYHGHKDCESRPMKYIFRGCGSIDTSTCLPKDRAIIVLLEKLLQKLE